MKHLLVGHTRCFTIECLGGYILIDSSWPDDLSKFFSALREASLSIDDIRYLMLTHFHPDHMGLAGELQHLGIELVVFDVQMDSIHVSDAMLDRQGTWTAIDEDCITTVPIASSRAFLSSIGVDGEVLSTPSHSSDSVSFSLDSGDVIVGDLIPFELCSGDSAAEDDWEMLLEHGADRLWYAHWPGG